jgi:hypothetical protein
MQVQTVTDQGTEFAPQYWRRQQVDCLDRRSLHRGYRPDDFLLQPRRKRVDLHVKSAGSIVEIADVSYWLVVTKDGYSSSLGECLMQ